MASPFPGMDPFLEHPAIFPDLHGRLNTYISAALQPLLPKPYFAVINERLWIENQRRQIEPDVDLIRGVGTSRTRKRNGAHAAVAASAKPILITIADEEHREMFVEIRTRAKNGGERIVTSIEVLSLSNKTPGQHGRTLYMQKQEEVLSSDIHLVEIDLLRGGKHTTAVPRRRIEDEAGNFDYHICVHQFDRRPDYFVYPILMEEPLPEIAIPLLPGDGSVPLNLQTVFNTCYDSGPYRRRLQYRPAEIVPPLPARRMKWVRERLKGALGKE